MRRRRVHIVLALPVALVLAAPACGAERGSAALTVEEGDNLPCLGVHRLRVTAFRDRVDGVSVEVFGRFYQQDGSCDLAAGLPLELGTLPYTGAMWVRVEGFDSSRTRRMCRGETSVFKRDAVDSGDLGAVRLDRDAVDLAYPTGTIVVGSLPGVAALDATAQLDFNLNPGARDSINGSFVRDPRLGWADDDLVLSSLPPREDNRLLVVARVDNQPVGQWREAAPFDILEGEMFVEVVMVEDVP
jgi:hypothetical protein